MTLSDEYKRQFEWRPWGRILDALPQLGGRTVLDLGCGLGDQAAALASRGARVLGVDSDEALLAVARPPSRASADARSPLPMARPGFAARDARSSLESAAGVGLISSRVRICA